MDIQKEREAFEKEMLNSRYVAGNISAFWDKKTQDYDIAITELRMAWHAWQAAKAQAAQEWINVDDRLPPVDETVLVCWDYAPDIEPEKEYTTLDENLDEYWPNCQDEPPTHWMLLPRVVKAQEPAND